MDGPCCHFFILGWYNRSASALPDATVVTDTNFEIIWANDAAQTYLGIRGTRDAGQRIDNLVRDLEFQRYVKDNDSGYNCERRAQHSLPMHHTN